MISGYVDVFLNNILIAEVVTTGDQDTIEAIRHNDSEKLESIGNNLASSIPDLDIAVILETDASVLYPSKSASTTGLIASGWYDQARK